MADTARGLLLAVPRPRRRSTVAPVEGDAPPRWVAPAVAALCVLALALRAPVALHGGLTRDEAQFLAIVGEPSWGAMLAFLRDHESHPPLFYALVRVWLSVAGDGDATALALPVALGGALVPALHVVGSRLFSWRAGLVAAAAGAVSPVLAGDASTVRPYSLLALLVLAATYALVRAVDLGGRARWAGYAAAVLALVLTHNWGWLVVAGHAAAVAVRVVLGTSRPRRAVLAGWVAALAAAVLGYLPWLPSFVEQSAYAGYSPMPVDGLADHAFVVAYIVTTSTLVPPAAGALGAVAVLWVVAIGALGAALVRRARPAAGVVRTCAPVVLGATPLVAIGVAAALSPRSNLLVPHCLGILLPILLLALAAGLDRWHALGQPRLLVAGAAVLVAGGAAALPPLLATPRSSTREVARAVAAQAAPTDLVVVSPWFLAPSFNRYFRLPTEQLDLPAAGRVGAVPFDGAVARTADPAALADAEQRVAAARAAGRRVWFVSDGSVPACTGAACGALVAVSRDFTAVGTLRTEQLRERVVELYGPATRCLPAGGTRATMEPLGACLFEVG